MFKVATSQKTHGGRLSGPMLVGWGAMQVAKRVGLAKPLASFALHKILSEKVKRRAFAGYEPTEHDVFVATFGKSGTNWMMQIAQQIAYRGAAEFAHIHDMVPWPDAPAPHCVPLDDPTARDGSPTDLRVIKTHLETDYIPYDEKAVYLTVLRDPKEVLVSAYYFLGGIMGMISHVGIEDWIELSRDSIVTGWSVHAASFWAWRDRPNVLVVNFREVKEQPRECIERVASRMGVTLTEAEFEKVIERSSLSYMKAHESQFQPPQAPFTRDENATLMVRRGMSGDSGELLSREQQKAIDHLCQEKLRELGSDFPYSDWFDVVT